MIKRTKKSSTNQKVRNATKVTIDGIEFKSKLEAYTYNKLKDAGIKAGYETNRYTLLEKFTYKDENIRAMTYKPDFVGDGFIIECKGMITDTFPLRWKLFKWYLTRNDIQDDVYLVRNQKQVNEMIEDIKKKYDETRILN
jgi:hypothetical protein